MQRKIPYIPFCLLLVVVKYIPTTMQMPRGRHKRAAAVAALEVIGSAVRRPTSSTRQHGRTSRPLASQAVRSAERVGPGLQMDPLSRSFSQLPSEGDDGSAEAASCIEDSDACEISADAHWEGVEGANDESESDGTSNVATVGSSAAARQRGGASAADTVSFRAAVAASAVASATGAVATAADTARAVFSTAARANAAAARTPQVRVPISRAISLGTVRTSLLTHPVPLPGVRAVASDAARAASELIQAAYDSDRADEAATRSALALFGLDGTAPRDPKPDAMGLQAWWDEEHLAHILAISEDASLPVADIGNVLGHTLGAVADVAHLRQLISKAKNVA